PMTTIESVSEQPSARCGPAGDRPAEPPEPGPPARVRPSGPGTGDAGDAWLVTRYHDVVRVTSDPRCTRQAPDGPSPPRPLPHIPLGRPAGPAAALALGRVRQAMSGAGTAAGASHGRDRLRTRALRAADALADELERHGRPADLMARLLEPLALTVACELMGVPERDRRRVAEWTGRDHREHTGAELRDYLTALLQRRCAEPRDDLAGELAEATVQGELGTEEAVSLAVRIHSGTAHALRDGTGAMLHLLLTHPEQLARLRARPALLTLAVEELLRRLPHADGPGAVRAATEDLDIGGTRVPAGATVHLAYSVANHDPAAFDRPRELDLAREGPPQLSFGHGAHRCPGAGLVRLVARTVLAVLLRRFPALRAAGPPEPVRWRDGTPVRGPERLPVTW
ncbi:cytochrome P450, partial [Streptomyces sp. NPDC049577]|uniref:cytochrome P450 n=1 Tax=Streptomyces sp. NPDC049577 TaxID=3155153 RepID=UPI00342684E3